MIVQMSARRTTPYQMLAPFSTVTSPIRVAVGATNASGWTLGRLPSNSKIGMLRRYRSAHPAQGPRYDEGAPPMGLSQIVGSLSGSRVYGEPVVTDNATLIPVTRQYRTRSTAVGMMVVREGGTTWVPVVDADRIATIGVVTGFVAATLGCLAVLRRPPW